MDLQKKLTTNFIKASFDPDINRGHYLVMPDYERVLYDYLRRSIPLSFRARQKQANGYPHRYADQKKIPKNAAFIAPDNASAYGLGANPTLDSDHGREFETAYVKALTSRLQYTYFEKRWAEQYSQFEQVLNNDMNDVFEDFARTKNNAIWNGKATSLNDTSTLEYCGILNQITDVAPIADGVLITDAIQTHMAARLADLQWSGMPTAIYANPVSIDVLIKEEQSRNNNFRPIEVEITPGHLVPGIITQAGKLPLIGDPYIPVAQKDGKTEHKFVLMNEKLIDRIWFDSPNAMLFEIANPSQPYNNTELLTDKMILQFDAYILRGAYVGYHSILTKTM